MIVFNTTHFHNYGTLQVCVAVCIGNGESEREYCIFKEVLCGVTVFFCLKILHVCVCVCMYIMYMYIYVYVCVCVCVFQMKESMSLCCLTLNPLLRSSWMPLTRWIVGPGGDSTGVPKSSKWSRWKHVHSLSWSLPGSKKVIILLVTYCLK